MIEIMLGCIAVMFVLIICSKQEDAIEERKSNLQKKMDAVYPPGYLPGIDPEPEPPQLRMQKSW